MLSYFHNSNFLKTMKKILVLGWYGTVGAIIVDDLVKSWFFVGIWGRNDEKIKALQQKYSENMTVGVLIDFSQEESLVKAIHEYDIVINAVEYTLNQMILNASIEAKVHYIDLGDYSQGIETSWTKNTLLKENNICAILWAGSSPGIINVMIEYLARNKASIETILISFSDIIKQEDERMLPFNFQTVVEEITWNALAFEDGKYVFYPGASKSIPVDFGKDFWKADCVITNHDEPYSLPISYKKKGLKNCYFVMNHNPLYLQLIPLLEKIGLLSEQMVQIWNTQVKANDFIQTYMKRFLPAEFSSDDTEILFAKVDQDTIWVINTSQDWIPAGILNTGIGASLIAQYLAQHKITPWIHHPEDCIDPDFMIRELKKRNFIIQLNGENI